MKSISLVIHDLILRKVIIFSTYNDQTFVFECIPGVTTSLSNGYHYIDLKFCFKGRHTQPKLRNYTYDMLIRTL